MPFVAACAQIAPEKGKVAANLDTIAEVAAQAASEGANLVEFPECAVTGYFLEGGVLEAALPATTLAEQLSKRLNGKLKAPLDVAVGFYEIESESLYNACAYLEFAADSSWNVRHVYHKFFLPTYGVFDEERFVSRGRELGVFDTRFGRFGLLICEDVWHTVLSGLVALNGAQVVLAPSASPARGFGSETPDNLNRYERLLQAMAEEHNIFAINSQLCGFEGGKGFSGGSIVVDPFGKVIARSPIAEPHLVLTEIDLDMIPIARAKAPLLDDLRSSWGDLKRLVEATP